jgi:hypothetical protein
MLFIPCRRTTPSIATAAAAAAACWPPAGGFNPQFFPSLQSIQALFSRPLTAASFLVHVLAINLIAARSMFLDGERTIPGRREASGTGRLIQAAAAVAF